MFDYAAKSVLFSAAETIRHCLESGCLRESANSGALLTSLLQQDAEWSISSSVLLSPGALLAITARIDDASVRHAAITLARTDSNMLTSSSTCPELKSPSGPRGVKSVNGDS